MTPDELFQYNAQFAKGVPPDTTLDPRVFQTKLKPAQEHMYNKWLSATAQDTGIDYDPNDASYDMRGYWKDVVAPGRFKRMGKGQHFPDTYKTPYHPTFSRESKFANENAPLWKDDVLVDAETGQPTPGYLHEIAREKQ
jgi:hypothetical protein